ncbi:membrane-associated proteins in eicosanoid and glutathione metabolism, partial [Hesseltinella vesiculosa]
MPIVIPNEYAYVMGVSVASVLQLIWLSISVGKARSQAGVPYPYMYAEKSEAEKDPKKNKFNCAQRAHQNSLEMFPVFTTLLLVGGISHPELAAASGALFLTGRTVYAMGYKTGDPKKRTRGAFGMVGLLALLFASGSTLYKLLA